ncbi:MAG: hypothetical protein WCQ99_10685 [Pseudomonadota bacterium]
MTDADEAYVAGLKKVIQTILIILIYGGGCLVQKCKLGISQEKSCEGHALFLCIEIIQIVPQHAQALYSCQIST